MIQFEMYSHQEKVFLLLFLFSFWNMYMYTQYVRDDYFKLLGQLSHFCLIEVHFTAFFQSLDHTCKNTKRQFAQVKDNISARQSHFQSRTI